MSVRMSPWTVQDEPVVIGDVTVLNGLSSVRDNTRAFFDATVLVTVGIRTVSS